MIENGAIKVDKVDVLQLELYKVMAQQHQLQINTVQHQANIWLETLREKYATPESVYTFTGDRFILKEEKVCQGS